MKTTIALILVLCACSNPFGSGQDAPDGYYFGRDDQTPHTQECWGTVDGSTMRELRFSPSNGTWYYVVIIDETDIRQDHISVHEVLSYCTIDIEGQYDGDMWVGTYHAWGNYPDPWDVDATWWMEWERP